MNGSMSVAIDQHRQLGIAAMVGGAAYMMAGIIMMRTGNADHVAVNSLGLVWALGAMCGLVGMGLLGVAGRGVFGRIALAVAVVSYALAVLDAVLILMGSFSVEDSPLFLFSRLGTLVGMMLVGIAVVVERHWSGWRRFSPFSLLLALPVTIIVGLVVDEMSPLPAIGLAWILIGYAVWSTREST